MRRIKVTETAPRRRRRASMGFTLAELLAVIAIIGNWNWFFEPLIYLNNEDLFPLALGVKILTATTSSGAPPMWNRVFTCSMILIIPMVAVYFVGQKYMYEVNLSAGSAGVK